ncbi:hypothetical protein B0H13DRAFT_2663489 [Mycena leptocephala]|nr:hypothetical protein B0H13DRAFT_2663489 [Mycena leptocephala]
MSTCSSAPSYTSAPNSLPIRMRFDYLTAPTSLSRWPSPPRSWISLATSPYCSVHRGVSCAEPPTSLHPSSIKHTHTHSSGLRTSLIPVCRHADDARAQPLGVHCRKSPNRPRTRVGALRDPFTSVKQLRPLPPRTRASCARTSCISCAYRWRWMEREKRVDGDWMTMQMQMQISMKSEKRADRDGNERWRWNVALAFVPVLAFPLVPVLRECRRRCRLGGTRPAGLELRRYAYAPAHSQRWRSAGAGTGAGAVRGPPFPHRRLHNPLLLCSRCSAYALRKDVDIEAGVYACAYGAYPPSSSHSRSSSSDLPLASSSFFYVDAEGVLRRS